MKFILSNYKKIIPFFSVAVISLILISCGRHDQNLNTEDGHSFREGIQYTVLQSPIDRPKNEVIEFFWYGCPHCYEAESYINEWISKTSSGATLIKAHSQLSNKWMTDAFVFYSLYGISRHHDIGSDFFSAKRNGSANSKKELTDFLSFYSLTLDDLKLSYSRNDTQAYQKLMGDIEHHINSNGVPAFLVGGKYVVRLEGLSECGSWKCIDKVLDFLVLKSKLL